MNNTHHSKSNMALLMFVLAIIIVQCAEPCYGQRRTDHSSSSDVNRNFYPNGGERIVAGQTVDFSWDRGTFPVDDLLQIEYWDFALGSWKTMSSNLPNSGSASIVVGPIGRTRHRIVSERTSSFQQSSGYWEVIDPSSLRDVAILQSTGSSDHNGLATTSRLLVCNEEEAASFVRTSARPLRVIDLNGREYDVSSTWRTQDDVFAHSTKRRQFIMLIPTSGDSTVPIVALIVD